MLPRTLEETTLDHIRALVDGQVDERMRLEYKREVHTDFGDFAVDITSFANTVGGDMIIGLDEARDANGNKLGYPAPWETQGIQLGNTDELITRLNSKILDKELIEPRIIGVRFLVVDGLPNGSVLIVRIPRSLHRLHMVRSTRHHSFYMRSEKGAYPLRVHEIQAKFEETEAVANRMRRFLNERLATILTNEGAVSLGDGPKTIVHMLPLQSFELGLEIPAVRIRQQIGLLHVLRRGPGMPSYMNQDGVFMASSLGDGDNGAYLQVFRSGVMETVSTELIRRRDDGRRNIPVSNVESALAAFVHSALRFYRDLGFEPPVSVLVQFTGVRGYTLEEERLDDLQRIRRDTLECPRVTFDRLDYERVSQVGTALRPVFDVIWQACQLSQSRNFRDDGTWVYAD